MESFWSPESIVWWKLRTFLCGRKLILPVSTKQWFVLPTPIAGLTCPNTNCLSSQLLASRLVICGLRVTSLSGRMPQDLLHAVYNEFGPKQFICVHQLHPCLCRHPLARHCQCQPTRETLPSALGPLEIAVFTTHAAHVMETNQGSAAHFILVYWVPLDILYVVSAHSWQPRTSLVSSIFCRRLLVYWPYASV